MINVSIARRYARALIAVSLEAGRVDEVADELGTMASVIATSPEVRGLLQSPGFTREQRHGFLEAFAKKASFAEPTISFLRLLIDRGRTEHVEQISRIYQDLADEAAGRVRAQVVTPTKLNESEAEALSKALGQLTGQKILLEQKVDESLIGGLVAKVGDRVFDGSLRTQLEGIRKSALS